MKLHTRLASGLSLLGGMMLVGSAWAGCPAPIPLPAPGDPSTSVLFGDAVVYSLPLLNAQGVIPTGVQSSPGQINDCIVVGSGAGGTVVTNNLIGSADDAYQNVQGDQNPYFRTGDTTLPNNTDPNGAGEFVGDQANTWDIKVSALKTFLAGGSLTFLFNHNQTNSGASVDQDLFIWAQVALQNFNTGAIQYFYVSAMANNSGLTNFGVAGGLPTSFTGTQTAATNTYPSAAAGAGTFPLGGECSAFADLHDGLPSCGTTGQYMVHARGQICLDASDVPVPCDGSGGAVKRTLNDNLGANEVANAAVFPELNALLAGLSTADALNSVIHIDWRMGCNTSALGTACPGGSVLNNGFEQLFIIGGPQIPVPEPTTIALLGAALLGLAAGRRRKQ